jgi:hypothetical protein
MTFTQFIELDPELTPYARDLFARINAEAERVGARIIANTTSDELRARSGSPWLLGINRIMADALARDSSGRLAAVPALRAWAYTAGVSQTWLNWHVELYLKYLDAQKNAARRRSDAKSLKHRSEP